MERFYEVMDYDTAQGSFGTRSIFFISDPKTFLPSSYQALCEHLDQPCDDATFQGPDDRMVVSPVFLEVDESWYPFLTDCHRKVAARHKELNGNLMTAYKGIWP